MAWHGVVAPEDGEYDYDTDGEEIDYTPDYRLEWPLVKVNWPFAVDGKTGNFVHDKLTLWCLNNLKGPWAVNTLVEDHEEMNTYELSKGRESPCDNFYANNEYARDKGGWGVNIKTKADRARFEAQWKEYLV